MHEALLKIVSYKFYVTAFEMLCMFDLLFRHLILNCESHSQNIEESCQTNIEIWGNREQEIRQENNNAVTISIHTLFFV